MNQVAIKRIYVSPSKDDGYRILVDRIWPRGVRKEDAKLDEWKKEIAPSNELRTWFGHEPDRFGTFAKKYRVELKEKREELDVIREKLKSMKVTLLYGAKDTLHNQAVVLQEFLLSEGAKH